MPPDAAKPQPSSEYLVQYTPFNLSDPPPFIRYHTDDRNVAQIRNSAWISVTHTIDNDHRNLTAFCLNNLASAPLARRVGISMHSNDRTSFNLIQYNDFEWLAGRNVVDVKETRKRTIFVDPISDVTSQRFTIVVML